MGELNGKKIKNKNLYPRAEKDRNLYPRAPHPLGAYMIIATTAARGLIYQNGDWTALTFDYPYVIAVEPKTPTIFRRFALKLKDDALVRIGTDYFFGKAVVNITYELKFSVFPPVIF